MYNIHIYIHRYRLNIYTYTYTYIYIYVYIYVYVCIYVYEQTYANILYVHCHLPSYCVLPITYVINYDALPFGSSMQ